MLGAIAQYSTPAVGCLLLYIISGIGRDIRDIRISLSRDYVRRETCEAIHHMSHSER